MADDDLLIRCVGQRIKVEVHFIVHGNRRFHNSGLALLGFAPLTLVRFAFVDTQILPCLLTQSMLGCF